MRAFTPVAAVGVLLVGISMLCAGGRGADMPPAVKAGQYTLTGPFVQENLSIYLVHAPDVLKDIHYLTLQEALDKKIVVVHETGDVNELSIENLSTEGDVFIQSGDIVKGGRQDRTIAFDFICPPKSGVMAINAFCVEHGRWSRRGVEDAAAFGSSANAIAGKDLKLAAKAAMDQGQVWQQVAANQSKLSSNAMAPVIDPASASSFELTLENKKVREASEAYAKSLRSIVEGKNDVVGYVMAINGELNSSDVYGSHELFAKLWPKMLDAAAVEAFAELKKDKKFEPVKIDAIKSAIEEADAAKDSTRDVTPRVQLITRQAKADVLFETRDRASHSPWIHRNYITGELHRPADVAPAQRNNPPAQNDAPTDLPVQSQQRQQIPRQR